MKNPLSIEAFADWAERKPPEEWYSYADACSCAFQQYLKAVGIPVLAVGRMDYATLDGKEHPLPEGVDEAVRGHPRTFSALAKRLRAMA